MSRNLALSFMPRLIDAGSIQPQPWRNGGGRTRELLVWPDAGAWRARVSLADIEADGPFSTFDGVRRWFAVVDGRGVRLHWDDREACLRPGDAPCEFDGARAPMCHLLGGPTQDLNLMLRGASGVMRAARADEPWTERFAQRGLFAAAAGRWSAGARTAELAARQLLWSDEPGGDAADASAWRFEPRDPDALVVGWWIGFDPTGSMA